MLLNKQVSKGNEGKTNTAFHATWDEKVSTFYRRCRSGKFSESCLILAFAALLPACGALTPPGHSIQPVDKHPRADYRRGVIARSQEPGKATLTPISQALVQEQVDDRPRQVPEEIKALFGDPAPYTIGPSDVVSIIVYDHPELLPSAGAVISQSVDPTGISPAPGFIVSAEGDVSFPYIGRFKLGGLTEIQAATQITKRLAEFVQKPQVTVRIQSFRSRRAYVQGEVRSPGLLIFTDVPMTLPEAISRAGGITSNGDHSSIGVTRKGRTTTVDLMIFRTLNIDPNSILLQSGDLVTVRNRDESKVYVMGEILRPSALIMRNGRLSLNEALGEAGGTNLLTARPGQIYVIRSNERREPTVFHLDAKSPAAFALADRFELQARDVVYVDKVPLVQWNRIISLILPSAQVLNATTSATRN